MTLALSALLVLALYFLLRRLAVVRTARRAPALNRLDRDHMIIEALRAHGHQPSPPVPGPSERRDIW